MTIKEIEQVLEEALTNPDNSELKTRYSESVTACIKEDKPDEGLISVIVRGFDIDEAVNLFDYIRSLTNKNDIQSIWKLMRENKTLSETNANNGLKLLLSLLGISISKSGNFESIRGSIISKIVSMIDDSKNPISKDSYTNSIRKYFIDGILSSCNEISWKSFNLSGNDAKRLSEIILEAIDSNEDEKYHSVLLWAKNGSRYADELLDKERIESRIPKSRSAELQILVEHYKDVEKQLRDEIYKIDELEKKIVSLQNENSRLEIEKSELKKEIAALNGDLDDNRKVIEQKEKEIDERKKINDAADALKKNDEAGLLRDIANDLKAQYSDFKDSEGDVMDEQLGEIYREKIRNIFKILEKKGIRME